MVTDNGLLYLIILVPTKAKFPNTKNNTFHTLNFPNPSVSYI